MSTSLEGKIALVTGGSRDIGRAIALRLGRDGALVGVHYGRDQRGASSTVKEIESPAAPPSPSAPSWGRYPVLKSCSSF
jgi:3-oxoacyl-[acyl-carrier protein] reductase